MRICTLLLAPAAAALLAACGPPPSSGNACSDSMLPGDVVITEIMANPDGTDEGQEWFEIYNATGGPLDIGGLRIVTSRTDLSGEKAIAIAAETGIVAGHYFVLGDAVKDAKPEWIDYAYGSALGAMRNSDARLALVCRNTIIDEVFYTTSSDGASSVLSGAIAPDYTANDVPENWCKATVEYTPGNLGSPGAPNELCPGGPTPTRCQEGGVDREIVTPQIGDLVVSEVMADPSLVDDTKGEWFEVQVVNPVDLNGLQIGVVPGEPKIKIEDTACLRAQAGTHLVFARSNDVLVNGHLPKVDHTFSFSLANSGGTLFVGAGDAVLDQMAWTSTKAGVSLALDPTHASPLDNDDSAYWCPATSAYGDGDLGTPGSPNGACPVVVPDGQCLEGENLRAVVAPVLGDLRLTEVMADPSKAADTTGEWFELRADRAVDLNGLELGTDPAAGTVRQTVRTAACIPLTLGQRVVFARSDDPASNGRLPQVDQLMAFTLTNSGSGLFIGHGGTRLSEVTWTSSSAGRASSRVEDGDTWCTLPADAAYAFGDGDYGTPGQANPACP